MLTILLIILVLLLLFGGGLGYSRRGAASRHAALARFNKRPSGPLIGRVDDAPAWANTPAPRPAVVNHMVDNAYRRP